MSNMNNFLPFAVFQNRSITPHVAEIWVSIFPGLITLTTELRGRLMGPTCQFATTVEVAYPMRPLPKGQKPPVFDRPSLTMAVSIPEPSLWDPVSPFMYRGQVELWEDGRQCGRRINVRHGLKSSNLTPRGLIWNGQPLELRGRSGTALSDLLDDLLTWRARGYNLLIREADESIMVWELADHYGFLVLSPTAILDQTMAIDSARPSHLGWFVEGDLATQQEREQFKQIRSRVDGLLGVAPASPTKTLPPGVDFVLCGPALAADLSDLGLPIISLDDAA